MSYFTPEQMTEYITETTLPKVILDLILASTNKIHKLKIPVSNLTGNFGIDGEIELPDQLYGALQLPLGKLYLEMGVNKDIKSKANSDYIKRKSNAKNDVTYVFITSQIFNKSTEWREEKLQEKDFGWKDIICLTQADLYSWFQRCPSVTTKWAEIWGLSSNDLYTLKSVWKRWENVCNNEIPYTLVCALGYQAEDKNLNERMVIDFLSGDKKKFIITASSVEEARLYLTGILLSAKIKQQEQLNQITHEEMIIKTGSLLDRVICLDSKAAFQKLPLKQFTQTVLVTSLQDADVIQIAMQNNIKVIQVLRTTNTRERVDIALPVRIKETYFTSVLLDFGLSLERINELSINSGRNLSTLRSYLADEPQDWAKDISDELLVALLVGGWSSEYEDDINAILELSSCTTYIEFVKKITKYLNKENSPIQHEEPYYRAISSFSSFPIIIEHITPDFLRVYKDVCIKILTKTDNIKILPENEHLLAQIKGVTNNFSPLIRKSMADSLIHLSMLYQGAPDTIDNIVSEVCSGGVDRWKSISPFTLQLAEASPKKFINKLYELLNTEKKENLQTLVNDSMGILEGFGAYTSIIFSLELLAWEEKYFKEVVELLFKLIAIWDNIPSNVGNSPLISLSDIFCIWLPQTKVSLDKKIVILKQMVEKYPKETSILLIKLLPPHNAIISSGTKAKWKWKDDEDIKSIGEISTQEYLNYLNLVFNLSLQNSANNIELLATLLSCTLKNPVSNENYEKLIDYLYSHPYSIADKLILWNKLRVLIVNAKKYADSKIDISRLAKLEEIYETYTPDDLYEKNIHYFYDYENCLEIADNFEWYTKLDERIIKKQKSAVHEIYVRYHINGLLELTKKISRQNDSSYFIFGKQIILTIIEPVLNSNSTEEMKEFIFQLVNSDIKHMYKHEFCKFFIENYKSTSLSTTYELVKSLGEEFFVNYLLALSINEELLVKINSENNIIQEKYWQQAELRSVEIYALQINILKKLIKYKNFIGAATLIAYHYNKVDDFALISKLLDALLGNHYLSNISHVIEILFKRISVNSEDEWEKIFKLEWEYYPILKNKAYRLYNMIAKNPHYFLFFIRLCFKSDKQTKINVDTLISRQAYDLIKTTPLNNAPLLQAFRNNKGNLDYEKLDRWFSSLKEIAISDGYEKSALSIAGEHLAYSGKVQGYEYLSRNADSKLEGETSQIFPEAPIRKLLNNEENSILRDSYKSSFLNRHGSWSGSSVAHYTYLKAQLEKNLLSIEPTYDILHTMFNELIENIDKRILWCKQQERHEDMGV